LRERSLGDARLLWPEDESTRWLELTLTQLDGYAIRAGVRPDPLVRWRDKATDAWSGPPDRILDAELQRFEGGLIILLHQQDRGQISLVIGGDRWEEVRSP
jgi:hypothetical protein